MQQNNNAACVVSRYEVTRADLPLSCPMSNMQLWDAHPRVYLPIEKTGHVVCPYCDAEYFLKDFNQKQETGVRNQETEEK